MREHRTDNIESIPVSDQSAEGYAGHGGGDFGLVNALDQLMSGPTAIPIGLDGLAGHQLAYLAETSRINGAKPVNL